MPTCATTPTLLVGAGELGRRIVDCATERIRDDLGRLPAVLATLTLSPADAESMDAWERRDGRCEATALPRLRDAEIIDAAMALVDRSCLAIGNIEMCRNDGNLSLNERELRVVIVASMGERTPRMAETAHALAAGMRRRFLRKPSGSLLIHGFLMTFDERLDRHSPSIDTQLRELLDEVLPGGVYDAVTVLDRTNETGATLRHIDEAVPLAGQFLACAVASTATAALAPFLYPPSHGGPTALGSIGMARRRFRREQMVEWLAKRLLTEVTGCLAQSLPKDSTLTRKAQEEDAGASAADRPAAPSVPDPLGREEIAAAFRKHCDIFLAHGDEASDRTSPQIAIAAVRQFQRALTSRRDTLYQKQQEDLRKQLFDQVKLARLVEDGRKMEVVWRGIFQPDPPDDQPRSKRPGALFLRMLLSLAWLCLGAAGGAWLAMRQAGAQAIPMVIGGAIGALLAGGIDCAFRVRFRKWNGEREREEWGALLVGAGLCFGAAGGAGWTVVKTGYDPLAAGVYGMGGALLGGLLLLVAGRILNGRWERERKREQELYDKRRSEWAQAEGQRSAFEKEKRNLEDSIGMYQQNMTRLGEQVRAAGEAVWALAELAQQLRQLAAPALVPGTAPPPGPQHSWFCPLDLDEGTSEQLYERLRSGRDLVQDSSQALAAVLRRLTETTDWLNGTDLSGLLQEWCMAQFRDFVPAGIHGLWTDYLGRDIEGLLREMWRTATPFWSTSPALVTEPSCVLGLPDDRLWDQQALWLPEDAAAARVALVPDGPASAFIVRLSRAPDWSDNADFILTDLGRQESEMDDSPQFAANGK